MKWIISRYNHDISYLPEYTDEWRMYDRSEIPINDRRVIRVPNIGTDIYDKLTFIIDNYDNLPDVAVYTKANLFKYITKEEFDKVKDNKTFTPLLTQNHKVYEPVCRYVDGIYEEVNNQWYLQAHPLKYDRNLDEFMLFLGIYGKKNLQFAPGSNYILPKENILQKSKDFYEEARSYLEWTTYPGEAQLMERALYTWWK